MSMQVIVTTYFTYLLDLQPHIGPKLNLVYVLNFPLNFPKKPKNVGKNSTMTSLDLFRPPFKKQACSIHTLKKIRCFCWSNRTFWLLHTDSRDKILPQICMFDAWNKFFKTYTIPNGVYLPGNLA